MLLIPSLSHPLSDPWLAEPAWARSAVATVLDSRWPTGDESATWDLADQWYALADALSGPRVTAFEAAEQIMTGLAEAQVAPDGFYEAWERLSKGDEAPLNALVQIAAELGQLVEECGREIEAAKLAAWVELGALLTELAGLSIAVELTLGAAQPAGDGLIAASRVAIEQIFERLTDRVGGDLHSAPDPTTRPETPRTEAPGSETHRAEAPRAEAPRAEAQRAEAPRSKAARVDAPRPETQGGEAPGLGTRRIAADLPTTSAEAGMATRRLALPPRPDDRDELAEHELSSETRRIDPAQLTAGDVPADGQRGLPRQPTGSRVGAAVDADQVGRAEYADFLSTVADGIRANLAATASATETADRALRAHADEIAAEAASVRSRSAAQSEEAPPGWARIDRPPAAEVRSPGELRPSNPVRKRALEDSMPQAGDGRPDRLADPRVGQWFSLLNADGPSADPTRGLNCLDAVLALFETYQGGRPRVASARDFDGYAHGEPDRPVGGEWSGVRRIQRATGSKFQNLCPFVGGAEAGPAQAAVDAALRNLANHLHNSGHGAFAFILTDFDSGGCHAWAAANQAGTILFLDPQVGRISAEEPLYRPGVVSMDALVVDGQGRPAPLPYHGAGQWTAHALVP